MPVSGLLIDVETLTHSDIKNVKWGIKPFRVLLTNVKIGLGY